MSATDRCACGHERAQHLPRCYAEGCRCIGGWNPPDGHYVVEMTPQEEAEALRPRPALAAQLVAEDGRYDLTSIEEWSADDLRKAAEEPASPALWAALAGQIRAHARDWTVARRLAVALSAPDIDRTLPGVYYLLDVLDEL